jgi:hypothetical protein
MKNYNTIAQSMGYADKNDAVRKLAAEGNSGYYIANMLEAPNPSYGAVWLRKLGLKPKQNTCKYRIFGKPLARVSKETGIPYGMLYNRKRLGWNDERCVKECPGYMG